MAENLDEKAFRGCIQSAKTPVFVDFYNDGCAPCRRIAPIIGMAEEEFGGAMKFAEVNIGMNPSLIEEADISATPTLVIFKDGKEISRHIGAADFETIKEFIENNI